MAYTARRHGSVVHNGHSSACRMAWQGAASGSAPAHSTSLSCSTIMLGQRAVSHPCSDGAVGSKMAVAVHAERLSRGQHQG
jgi:hypothetical protein